MPVTRSVWLAPFILACGAFSSMDIHAAEITRVLDAFDGDTTWHGSVGVRYERIERRARLLREWVCRKDNALGNASGGSALCPEGNAVLDTHQLAFSESINILNVDLRAGLWRDLELFVTLPIVVGWSSTVDYDDGVDGGNSLVSGDLIPSLFGVPYSSANRAGVGDLILGIKWAPLNEERRPGLPSWTIGVQYTAPTGEARSAGTAGVGEGIHALEVQTALSRRFGIVDPYLQLRGTFRFPDPSGPFKNERTTQTRVAPGNSIGMELGTEISAWNQPSDTNPYVSVDVGFKASITFDGREQTELFDALGSSACDTRPVNGRVPCPRTTFARVDRQPDGSEKLRKTDGITDVEQYADLGAKIGVSYRPIEHLKVRLGFDYDYTTEHFITFADAGRDLDPVPSGTVDARNSEGVNEYNPFYNDAYDAFGRRFRVADKHSYTLMFSIEGQL